MITNHHSGTTLSGLFTKATINIIFYVPTAPLVLSTASVSLAFYIFVDELTGVTIHKRVAARCDALFGGCKLDLVNALVA